jgi:hypothetical protein
MIKRLPFDSLDYARDRLAQGRLTTFSLGLILVFLSGCVDSVQKPQTEGIKIGELAPAGQRVRPQVLRTTNIDIVIFELPAENVRFLDDVWGVLDKGTLRFNDPNGFAANKLRAATGKFGDLDKINKTLKSADAKKQSTTTLLISDGRPEVLNISRMTGKSTISYIGHNGAVKSSEAGPGILALEISARKIINKRGTAGIQVLPVIYTPTEGLVPAIAERLKDSDLRFFSAGFGLDMKPGDIIVLSPSQFNPDEITAAGRFFTKTGQDATVKVLLIVCTSVN